MTDARARQDEADRAADISPSGADADLDTKGLLCPLPVYKASQAMGGIVGGEVLRIECTDPGSLRDFPAFARQGGHELLSAEEAGGLQTFYIRKGAAHG